MRKLAVAYGGSFLICSGNYALREDKEGIKIFNTAYEGTTIAIRVKTDKICNFEEVRSKIVLVGEKRPQMQKHRYILLQSLQVGTISIEFYLRRNNMDKMKFESPDLTAQNIDRIAALFPNCITEMLDEEHSTPEKKVYKRAVNFELLKQMLSPDVVDGDEAYEFTWVGKKAAIVEANKPIRKTLRPCVAESKDWDTTETSTSRAIIWKFSSSCRRAISARSK